MIEVVNQLNDEFGIHFQEHKDLLFSYALMVDGHPFKTSGPTEVNRDGNDDEDFTICEFRNHREFVQLVRAAERVAQNGEKAFYSWRGYRGFVAPRLPTITLAGLKMRLLNALQRISPTSDPEKKVKYIKINNKFYKY